MAAHTTMQVIPIANHMSNALLKHTVNLFAKTTADPATPAV